MKRSTFVQLEYILMEYPDYDKYIKLIETQLLNPFDEEPDKNIGGGRSGNISKPTEQRALLLMDDKRLNRLMFQKQAVDKIFEQSTQPVKKIIYEYYFKRPRIKTWDGIAQEVSFSRRQCINLRNTFFSKLADELGMIK